MKDKINDKNGISSIFKKIKRKEGEGSDNGSIISKDLTSTDFADIIAPKKDQSENNSTDLSELIKKIQSQKTGPQYISERQNLNGSAEVLDNKTPPAEKNEEQEPSKVQNNIDITNNPEIIEKDEKKPSFELKQILDKIEKAEKSGIEITEEPKEAENVASEEIKDFSKNIPEEINEVVAEPLSTVPESKPVSETFEESENAHNIDFEDSGEPEVKEGQPDYSVLEEDQISKIRQEKYPEEEYDKDENDFQSEDPLEKDDTAETNVIEELIIREKYTPKKTQWSKAASQTSEITEKDAGVVSVENIVSDYSDLILPEGATFEIEEFRLKTKDKKPFHEDHEETLSKIDLIYSEKFPSTTFDEIKTIEEEKTLRGKFSKQTFSDLFKPKKWKYEEYDLKIHGPLVDLTLSEPEGVDEVELYPVNEPYAYIRILYDKNTNEYLYKSIEPVLTDAENDFLSEIEQRLFETLDVNTKAISKKDAEDILKESVLEIIDDYGIKFDPAEREKILYHIHKKFLGDGLIDPIMHDKFIEDISCDGLNTPIFVYHSNYESMGTNLIYKKSEELDSFVTKLAQRSGKYISIAEPMLDATMVDGSRIQMTLGTEVTAHGSTFTIRKFKDEPITPTDLIEWGTFSPLSIAYIWLAVESSKSCIFAGGTASGKTTSLNAISLFIPPLAKIVTLEDTRELKLPHQNWIPSVTRESFDADGKGSIDMYELLRAALRQRPEYILVGEVRGHEALTLFQAMSTGHVTYATMHADSVASAVHRLENPPLNVPRNMLNSLDLVSVQVQARIGGQRIRRNKQLIEILDIDPRTNELITNEVFKWHAATDEIRYSGKSYILEEIMEEKGWDEKRMIEELKRRQEILEWMRLKKLRNYKDVGKVLMSYYRDPEAVMNMVRADIYE
ncbi:secretion system protein E [Methanoplanus sp. FWC-SCC4]|uniref:Secretion system protein E n=1 Tax=Methanochimaera problematica TaxID=2609417 RepID=A0AA97FAZ3_9EURY|nr:type II/IV secretion system ATPase subunit [Methanoplanus sp. FWC-SCC4]WOF15787.1 secretion system protein E [Methanoplanus sp. FWC-SCC4]